MAAIRSKDTKPERLVRRELRQLGLSGYRVHARLPGRPDIAFTRWKVAVFTDGAFWHGHPEYCRPGASDYWRTKIARTQERDRIADADLRALGWTVIRMWDFDVLANPAEAAGIVADALRRAGAGSRRRRSLQGNPRGARPVGVRQATECRSPDRRGVRSVVDRRAGPKQGPYVGKEPRSRNENGTWRKKRSDAKPKPPPKKGK